MSKSGQRSGLVRDVALLQAVAAATRRGTGATVTEVAAGTGREPSQVSRGLAALARARLVDRDPTTRAYRLGWQLYALTLDTREARLLELARRPMARLVELIDETVHLCVLDGTELRTLRSQSATHGFRAVDWSQTSVPAHRTSAGRVLLFDASRRAVARRFAGRDDVDADALYDEVVALRPAGYACVEERHEPGLVGASAPVRDHSITARGRIVAALNVSAPKDRVGDRLDMVGRAVGAAAVRLSRRLSRAT